MRTTKPLFVRPLMEAERATLEASLRSPDAFVLRRVQIVLSRVGGERSGQIAPRVGFTPQAMRDVIRYVARVQAHIRWDGHWHLCILRSSHWASLLLETLTQPPRPVHLALPFTCLRKT
jgi:hypothetical protein